MLIRSLSEILASLEPILGRGFVNRLKFLSSFRLRVMRRVWFRLMPLANRSWIIVTLKSLADLNNCISN